MLRCSSIFLRFLLVGMIFVLSLSGCATKSRLIKKPTPLPADLGIHNESEHLSFTLNHLILPDGRGAWVKSAKWDEYLLTIQNQAEKTLTIQGFWIVDYRGLHLASSQSPARLQSVSEVLAEEYESVQLKTALGVATAAASSTLISGGAVATTGTIAALGPLALLALPIFPFVEFKKRQAEELEKNQIQRSFDHRKVISNKYEPNVILQGSLFFPVVPNPRMMVVEYTTGGKDYKLTLPLDKLRGVHEAHSKKLEQERLKKEKAE